MQSFPWRNDCIFIGPFISILSPGTGLVCGNQTYTAFTGHTVLDPLGNLAHMPSDEIVSRTPARDNVQHKNMLSNNIGRHVPCRDVPADVKNILEPSGKIPRWRNGYASTLPRSARAKS